MKTQMQPLTICGKILHIGNVTQGENWNKSEFLIVTSEQYPKEILIHVWNDKIEQLGRCQVNDFIIARVNISSKKNQEKYYTEVTAWKIEIDFNAMRKEVTNEN